jgi:hypothetical protein
MLGLRGVCGLIGPDWATEHEMVQMDHMCFTFCSFFLYFLFLEIYFIT